MTIAKPGNPHGEPRTKAIYGLVDPRDGSIRYVGTTTKTLKVRLSNHWSDSMLRHDGRPPTGGGRKRIDWINDLRDHGMKPEIRLLDTVSSDDKDAERRWIKTLLRNGQPLTNGTFVPDPAVRKPVTRSLIVRAIERLHQHGDHQLADQLETDMERPW